MYKLFLSHTQLKDCLSILLENKLLMYDEKQRLYYPSAKGLQFIQISNQLDEFIPIQWKNQKDQGPDDQQQELESISNITTIETLKATA
jgi:hypothetical protein